MLESVVTARLVKLAIWRRQPTSSHISVIFCTNDEDVQNLEAPNGIAPHVNEKSIPA